MKLRPALSIYLYILLSLPSFCLGEGVFISEKNAEAHTLLKPFFYAIEDSSDNYSAKDILHKQQSDFSLLEQLKLSAPDHTIWLKTTIQTSKDLLHRDFHLSFDHLTFVDLYLFKDDSLVTHRQAGVFRKQSEISAGDQRLGFNLLLNKASNYQLLLKIKHTKKYPPIFNFQLQDAYAYLVTNRNLDLTNAWLQGALAILFLYACISWLVNRYRPFVWVALFLLLIGLYGFSLQPQYIDLLFPSYPETGWLLVLVYLHSGIISFYLLMADFLEIKKNDATLYRCLMYVIKAIPFFTLLCLTNNILTSNYYLTNQINLYISIVHLSCIGYTFFTLWNKLDSGQRFLLYGIIVFAAGAIALVGITFVLNEQGFIYAPIITKTTIILIAILFLAGIGRKLRQHEQEKIATLKLLNKLHSEHNVLIEHKVEERTIELQAMNSKLTLQQEELISQHNHIQTLMDELNHRVKNNLQMLYSLSTFQLPQIQNEKGKQVLNEMRSRIKAMMLVNEHLNTETEKQFVQVSSLTKEIKQHIQYIYDPQRTVKIELDIPDNFSLSTKHSLPFGLILTELFTNTFKHAFEPEYIAPSIKIGIFLAEEEIQLTYKDNGKGAEKLDTRSSMGISLIHDLARQLKGQLQINTNSGFNYLFTFPKH
ncbi:signal transduction histidine kinase [Pseudopedobacter saltans DSM 12145]|uniref:histidine kinase n=1 Tax=Pseudopedobacter saltans (strain ATCC 51119 / DSM 12145 / JCM 21818 / CCUG 39354 / LMG 10337 / NBRC 100064 / NCIMB 13643) TaxID=762903 RepID=F0SE40_PSESL|nr:histidine kinase dimerization/phosphoacceptor domain -containing protein [Pseudopedobacter saltans]ADY52966.1 signal transduction histidine kinase [Pseudopedobacter saltans DSM 12145]